MAEINIHLRAREADRALIDRAAELVGANRSQFMLASALNAAKDILLDQTAILVDAKTFHEIMEGMDAEATPDQANGMRRLRLAKTPWRG